MTAQEVFERDGFLIVHSHKPLMLGHPTEIITGHGAGAVVVPISEATKEEARQQALTAGWNWGERWESSSYVYKVVAE